MDPLILIILFILLIAILSLGIKVVSNISIRSGKKTIMKNINAKGDVVGGDKKEK